MSKSSKTWTIRLLAIGLLGYWIYRGITKPLPGEAVADMGAEHLTDIAEVVYNSNPPTSGPHFPLWAKPGVYDRFISEGYLLHSLEHGYVVISYDCDRSITDHRSPFTIYAHEEESVEDATQSGKPLMHMTAQVAAGTSWITPENPPEVEVALPDSFATEACKSLVNELSTFTKVAQRIIVVPRQGMETPIALTAWGRILKLNGVDTEAIKAFIKTFHNRGPEATTE